MQIKTPTRPTANARVIRTPNVAESAVVREGLERGWDDVTSSSSVVSVLVRAPDVECISDVIIVVLSAAVVELQAAVHE